MENSTQQENTNPNAENNAEEEIFSNPESSLQDGKVIGGLAEFDEFDEAKNYSAGGTDKLNFLKDLQLNVFIELGRTQMPIKEILELERGYVIELDKLASEPVDIYVNNKKIAEGEVVVIDKHFGIRITNLNEPNNRIKGIL